MLVKMLGAMDVTGDGHVTKVTAPCKHCSFALAVHVLMSMSPMQEEFRTVYLKLHPDTTREEYDALWLKVDTNKDGDLQPEELARFFGFDFNAISKDMENAAREEAATAELSDDQILEALQVRHLVTAGWPYLPVDSLGQRIHCCLPAARS